MYQIPEEVKKSKNNYKHALDEFLEGKVSGPRFKGIRVPWGIYTHRGGGSYMTRVRVPAGSISPSQLMALAEVSEKYGNGRLHLTTRQDIQIHNVRIEDTFKIIEYLEKNDLSPRGGGGNTVRNITTCALAGLCRDETCDVREQALALTELLLADEVSYNLPRKFKISFSGCDRDCAGCRVNDVGFLARDGGFKVWADGGMGAHSAIGEELLEHISVEDLPYCVVAIRNVFHKHGNPKDRHHSRLRFLVEDIGFKRFKELYEKEFQELKKNKSISLREMDLPVRAEHDEDIPKNDDRDYNQFLEYNVYLQKQKGWASVELRVPRGDISSGELKHLAGLERDFPGMEFRTSQNQNLLICWVRKRDAHKLFLKLKGILRDFLYPQTLLDVVACKGAQTCNLGVCNSPGLAEKLEEVIEEEFAGTEAFKKLEIKMNGCPNSCGQHPLGMISFYGLVKRIGNRPVPFYNVLLGGRKGSEGTRFAKEAGAIPARSVPDFLKDFLKRAEPHLKGDNDVHGFLDAKGREIALELVKTYSKVPPYEEDRDFYIDWGRTEEFSLAGISQGECGAGVYDMIDADLKDAKKGLDAQTQKDLYRALIFSCRALLVTRGVDTTSDSEVLLQFKDKFVETGIVAYRFRGVSDYALSLLKEEAKFEDARKYVRELYDEVSAAYKAMDSAFNFPVRNEIKKEADREKAEEFKLADDEILYDLRGIACPINYVKAKMKLEAMGVGQKLLLLLDPGEPIINVPASLKNDGQDVIGIVEKDKYFEVLVKKEV